MARPTDYTPELVEEARAYFDGTHRLPNEHVQSLVGLALVLGVSRETIYDWSNPKGDRYHEEFSDICKQILAQQEFSLVNAGLKGDFNPTITKLMLSKHGYRESSDITTDGKALPSPILGAATKEDVQINDSSI